MGKTGEMESSPVMGHSIQNHRRLVFAMVSDFGPVVKDSALSSIFYRNVSEIRHSVTENMYPHQIVALGNFGPNRGNITDIIL